MVKSDKNSELTGVTGHSMKRFMLMFIYVLSFICVWGRDVPEDSLEVSLMTCSPGQEVYALYGHTAIRVNNYATGEDWVFNYGMFSFNRPNFIWRFTRGECDYQIGAAPFEYFIREYAERGSAVYQQTLNLTTSEKLRLWALLTENMLPENRVYLYNFFYDNCTTRARDRIEEAVSGEIVYPRSDTVRTYREIVHLYTRRHPWAELGNDICLGCEADRPIGIRQEMFAPFFLMRYFEDAVIKDSAGNVRPLVLSTAQVVEGRQDAEDAGGGVSPALCAWGLFVVVLLLTCDEYRRRKCFWWLDALLMTLVGCMGLVVTFLFFFSIHPTVGSNWQIWVFNPIPLLAMPRVVYCAVKGEKTYYHEVNMLVLMFFILFSVWIPQDFCVVVVPLALTLWLRSCSYLLKERKRKD